MRRSLVPGVRVVLCLLALLAAMPAAADYSRDFSWDRDRLVVDNMIGRVDVKASADGRFRMTVNVRGADAAEGVLELLETGDEGGSLLIRFPVDEHEDYVYPALGDGRSMISYRTPGDHGGSWLRRIFSGGGDRISVRGAGRGLEVWADVTIEAPADARLKVRIGVGEIVADGVRSDLDLDTHSGPVTVADVQGRLRADTGSGEVRATRVDGDVNIDTGSGDVGLTGCRGDGILVDTGSGGVTITDAVCRKLDVDTGSGGVEARGVAADAARIDTGSGDVVLELTRLGDGRFLVDTGSGDIDLILPADASATIDADTGSGGVHNELVGAMVERMDRNEMRLVVGDGGARITLDAGSGSVTVSRK